ncbi:MAG TPA: hypothetical protein VLX92_06705 [Kofleriaceae bacterium]|nr:hypothetical protein [Kofleriaceae bacterium]
MPSTVLDPWMSDAQFVLAFAHASAGRVLFLDGAFYFTHTGDIPSLPVRLKISPYRAKELVAAGARDDAAAVDEP